MVLLFSLDNVFLEEIEDGKLPKRGGSSCKDELHVPVSLVLRRHLLVGKEIHPLDVGASLRDLYRPSKHNF